MVFLFLGSFLMLLLLLLLLLLLNYFFVMDGASEPKAGYKPSMPRCAAEDIPEAAADGDGDSEDAPRP